MTQDVGLVCIAVSPYTSFFKNTTEEPFLARLRRWQSEVFTDDAFKLFIRYIGPFDDDFFAYHHGGSDRQIQLEVFVGIIFRLRFGHGFDLDVILVTQPGQHLLEMLSRFSIGLIIKESDFQHVSLLL